MLWFVPAISECSHFEAHPHVWCALSGYSPEMNFCCIQHVNDQCNALNPRYSKQHFVECGKARYVRIQLPPWYGYLALQLGCAEVLKLKIIRRSVSTILKRNSSDYKQMKPVFHARKTPIDALKSQRSVFLYVGIRQRLLFGCPRRQRT